MVGKLFLSRLGLVLPTERTDIQRQPTDRSYTHSVRLYLGSGNSGPHNSAKATWHFQPYEPNVLRPPPKAGMLGKQPPSPFLGSIIGIRSVILYTSPSQLFAIHPTTVYMSTYIKRSLSGVRLEASWLFDYNTLKRPLIAITDRVLYLLIMHYTPAVRQLDYHVVQYLTLS